ncbi:GIY-YIG nuclease family protein [Candidatus Absconditicoccus praedator]|uniref:GIY-YIG nuclease family protein n=1 Tax=Candidatus Absconditicoccus praedator TaxID=2735562 RepID=UPI001E402226|nr:GIY-YIG nuclease family protein [Candidatus Absconditicoccus praedator]
MSSISGVLYIGMTNNLERRVYEHKNELLEGFTKKYKCKKLVYYESGTNINEIIAREKQLKKWNRRKKLNLIRTMNEKFVDLSNDW